MGQLLSFICAAAVFTNRLEDMRIQDLAEMDVKEMVQQVCAG